MLGVENEKRPWKMKDVESIETNCTLKLTV